MYFLISLKLQFTQKYTVLKYFKILFLQFKGFPVCILYGKRPMFSKIFLNDALLILYSISNMFGLSFLFVTVTFAAIFSCNFHLYKQ